MAEISQRPNIQVSAAFVLNESELRALDALAGYGADSFLDVFYKKLGEAYMKPHEQGLRSLFESIRRDIPTILLRADAARKAFRIQGEA